MKKFQSAQTSAVEAERRNKALRGVYRLASWRLIECLEDKLGDIRYPSGQRMGG